MPQINQTITPEKLSDKELFELSKTYGKNAVLWRRKFIGLLPEINKRKLFEKKNCRSIFEYAAKFGGVSHKQTQVTINLSNKFTEFPILQRFLFSGEVSLNKLVRVTAVVTHENETLWANKLLALPSRALETLIRDEQILNAKDREQNEEINQDFAKQTNNLLGLPETKNNDKRMHVHSSQTEIVNTFPSTPSICYPTLDAGSLPSSTKEQPPTPLIGQTSLNQLLNLNLTPEAVTKLNELKTKGFDISKLIIELLEKREEEITEEKDEILKQVQNDKQKSSLPLGGGLGRGGRTTRKPTTRYIPSRTRKHLKKHHGENCSVPTCNKLANQIHHTNHFKLSKSHDPNFLAPLCKAHHTLAHFNNLQIFDIQKKLGYG